MRHQGPTLPALAIDNHDKINDDGHSRASWMMPGPRKWQTQGNLGTQSHGSRITAMGMAGLPPGEGILTIDQPTPARKVGFLFQPFPAHAAAPRRT